MSATQNRPSGRPLLPQTTGAEFQFAAAEPGLTYGKKNYVFVDEHNRHKRLKVMRACEGCRRRKIKCDAATTNSWPCAACVRLKLQCIPPTVNYARSTTSDASASGLERVLDFDSSDASGDEGYMPQPPMTSYSMSQSMGFNNGSLYQSIHHRPSLQHMRHRSTTSVPMSSHDTNFHGVHYSRSIPSSHPIQMPQPQRQETWPPAETRQSNISEALGELKIDEAGVAPYIFHQKQKLAEAPALEEQEIDLPARPGATVRIPEALMPNDLVAMEYFEIFFREIHPYIPVISKPYFYSQWHSNRGSISPLLLEAVFACAGQLSDSDPSQGASWMALASKHEQYFMDVPRLSTLQALIILMKARENAPKRGYFYRSWMTVKTLIEMGKDLELDQHYIEHKSGRSCNSDATECAVKTRIWQTVFVIEQMIAGPQKRYDMSVDVDTVDFNIPQPNQGITREEYQVSYNFTYMVRVLRNIRYLTEAYAPIRKKKDWASDPSLAALNPLLPKWLDELPTGMQILYPEDGTEPWLPDHYTGNMHCYYHLGLMMLRRPQLMAASNFTSSGDWKQHMDVCYESAKRTCRIQESLISEYGLHGLISMTRGLNFAIYCILTSMMVHLVALTSPDPKYNSEARDYFTRHMRVLETCMAASPMKELQAQIQSLREAFSVDTSKAFELRPDIANPANMMNQQSMADGQLHSPVGGHGASMAPQLRLQIAQAQQQQFSASHSLPVTPISASADDLKDGHIAVSLNNMMAASAHPHSQPGQVPQQQLLSPQETIELQHGGGGSASFDGITTPVADDGVMWNPTPIFDSWQNAFGTPASSTSNNFNGASGVPHDQQSPTMYSRTGSSGGPEHDTSNASYGQMPPPATSPSMGNGQNYSSAQPTFVTPHMWQETVAATYGSNALKRRWDE